MRHAYCMLRSCIVVSIPCSLVPSPLALLLPSLSVCIPAAESDRTLEGKHSNEMMIGSPSDTQIHSRTFVCQLGDHCDITLVAVHLLFLPSPFLFSSTSLPAALNSVCVLGSEP